MEYSANGRNGHKKAPLAGFEPTTTQFRRLVLYPLSYSGERRLGATSSVAPERAARQGKPR